MNAMALLGDLGIFLKTGNFAVSFLWI